MKDLLKTYFGYDTFRPLQEEIITHIAAKNEALIIMATGGGKSLCYQLPALQFEGITLVISPLIALMKDQVDALKTNGIASEFINSTLSYEEIDEIQQRLLNHEIKILYVAPERLALPTFQDFLTQLPIDLIAIDEAHCISEWGHDFRPEYRNLKSLRKVFPGVPIVALTATATDKVRNDIVDQLGLHDAKIFTSSFNRKNLSYTVKSKKKQLDEMLSLLKKYENESVIIYCFSRKGTEDLAEKLQAEGLKALPYHAGLTTEKRRKTQEKFIRDEVSIIVATIAFGMGIDKPNVRLVVHQDLPKSIESYYQETGRAGRDGLSSECVMFFSYQDKIKHQFFMNQISDPKQRQVSADMLATMIDYAETKSCRRKFLLNYFGEEQLQANCQGCDQCLNPKEAFDATDITWKILSAILRLGERFGVNYVIDVLTGNLTEKVRERNHDELSVFGIASGQKPKEIQEIIQLLIAKNILIKTTGEYPVLNVTEKGKALLKARERITLEKSSIQESFDTTASSSKKAKRKPNDKAANYDETLFEQLRVLRKSLADSKQVPPFIIFGDVSLREMAQYLPQDNEAFTQITGVGQKKLTEYGDLFMNAIGNYLETKNTAR